MLKRLKSSCYFNDTSVLLLYSTSTDLSSNVATDTLHNQRRLCKGLVKHEVCQRAFSLHVRVEELL